jgi:hypothetical protein
MFREAAIFQMLISVVGREHKSLGIIGMYSLDDLSPNSECPSPSLDANPLLPVTLCSLTGKDIRTVARLISGLAQTRPNDSLSPGRQTRIIKLMDLSGALRYYFLRCSLLVVCIPFSVAAILGGELQTCIRHGFVHLLHAGHASRNTCQCVSSVAPKLERRRSCVYGGRLGLAGQNHHASAATVPRFPPLNVLLIDE